MSEQIKKSDIIQGEPFLEIKGTIDEALKSLSAYDEELKSVAKSFENASKSIKGTATDLSKLVEIEKKANQKVDEAKRLKKDQIILEKKFEKARLSEIRLAKEREKAFDRYEKQQEQINKQKEREKKLLTDQNNAYKQLAANTNKLKDESKRLGAELLKLEQSGKKNTKAYRDLSQQYRETSNAAKTGDSQLKKLDATVGDNQRKVGMYERALRGLNGTLGALGLAFGAGFIARGTLDTLVDFDEGLADIQKTTGLTKNEVK